MHSTLTHPDLPAHSVLDALAASGFDVDGPVSSSRAVLDTFDGRLHAEGLRLEHQAAPVAELVLTGAPHVPAARLAWTKAAPTFGADLPRGPFGDRVASVIEERALLVSVAVSATTRTATRRDRRGKATVVVHVHDDLAQSHPGAASVALPWVAEVIGVTGHDGAFESTVTRLAALGCVLCDGGLVDAVARVGEVSLAGHTSSPTIPMHPRQEALSAYRAVLANLAATITDNLDGTMEDIDPEFLHELRVAVRRTRSVLAQAKGVVPGDVRDRFREGFGRLGTITGPARDLDVYVMGWADMVAPLKLADPEVLVRVRKEIERRRGAAHRDMAVALAGEETRRTLADWTAWLADPDVEPERPRPVGPVVAARIAKAQAAVLEHGRAIDPTSHPEALHDLRKDAKKLRYLLECFGGLLPAKGRKAFVAQLKALQDNLGDHQDAEVQLGELRTLAHDLHERARVDTDALLAMGRLSDHLDRRRQHERDAFTTRFAAYDTKANRKALDALLAEAAGA